MSVRVQVQFSGAPKPAKRWRNDRVGFLVMVPVPWVVARWFARRFVYRNISFTTRGGEAFSEAQVTIIDHTDGIG